MQVTTLSPAKSTNGACSLPEAIANAALSNQSGSADCPAGGTATDTITFTVAGTINSPVYTGGSEDLVVGGGGAIRLTNAGGPGIEADGGTLRLAGLVLDGALSTTAELGGCLNSQDTESITIVDSTLTNCRSSRWGGAIYAMGDSSTAAVSTTGPRRRRRSARSPPRRPSRAR